jgi:hypothetical protein
LRPRHRKKDLNVASCRKYVGTHSIKIEQTKTPQIIFILI